MRKSIVLLACALAGAAQAQSFQTKLPLSPDDRRALEVQIGAFLDFARAGAVQQVSLPSGSFVTMRAYPVVAQPGSQPCRGYRLDLAGTQGLTAVDGFRCRRPDGRAWAIVEPETVLSQSGPLDLRNTSPDAPAPGEDSQPLYADAQTEPTPRIAQTPPPVPRPAPRQPAPTQTVTAELPPLAQPSLPNPDSDPSAAAPQAPSSPVAPPSDTLLDAADSVLSTQSPPSESLPVDTSIVERITDDASIVSRTLPDGAADAIGDPLQARVDEGTQTAERIVTAAVDNAEEAAETVRDTAERITGTVDDAAATVRRVVGQEAANPNGVEPSETDLADNPRIVDALLGLDYLPADGAQNSAAVRAAVSDFARDERFALPVAPWELEQRLTTALDRSQSLTPCAGNDTSLCIPPQ